METLLFPGNNISPYTVHPWWYEIIFDIEWWLLWPGLSLYFVDNSPVLRGRWMEINFQHLIYSMFLYHQNLEENSNKTNTKKIAINRDEQPAANPSSFCGAAPRARKLCSTDTRYSISEYLSRHSPLCRSASGRSACLPDPGGEAPLRSRSPRGRCRWCRRTSRPPQPSWRQTELFHRDSAKRGRNVMKTPREFCNYFGNLKSNELTNKKQTKENIYFSRGFITCNSREMSTLLREREDLGPTSTTRKFKLLDGSRYFTETTAKLFRCHFVHFSRLLI